MGTTFQVLILVAICASVISDEFAVCCFAQEANAAAKASEPQGTPAELTARIEGTPESPTLILKLRNTGSKPFIVDKDLSILLAISFSGANGDDIHPKECRKLPRPSVTPEKWRERFVSLKSGETMTRRVELRKGFRDFCVYLTTTDQGGALLHSTATYESESKYTEEEWKKVRKIEVRLVPVRMICVEVAKYTGLDPEKLGMFDDLDAPSATIECPSASTGDHPKQK